MTETAISFGVDTAVFQSNIRINALRDARATFAFAKASQSYWVDGFFYESFRMYRQGGLITGAYHFLLEPGNKEHTGYDFGRGVPSAAEQARTFVAAVKRANGGTLDGVLCAVDWENLNQSYDPHTKKTWKIKSAPSFKDVIWFIKEFHRLAPKHPIFLYAGGKLPGHNIRDIKTNGPVLLWLARWTISSENQLASHRHNIPDDWWTTNFYGKRPTIVQYQSGSHGGRVGNTWVDLDASNLSRFELKQYAYPMGDGNPDPDPDPNPGPDPEPNPQPQPDPWHEPWYDDKTGDLTTAGTAGVASVGVAGLLLGVGIVAMLGAVIYLGTKHGTKGTPVLSVLRDRLQGQDA